MLGVWLAAALDASCLGEEEARSVGVPIDIIRIGLLVCGGALAAVAVVLAGPIAFVGLVAPHAARALVGSRHRMLVPASMLAGAAMLVVAETVRQWIDLGGGRLPIGVLTALLGGPAFLGVASSARSSSMTLVARNLSIEYGRGKPVLKDVTVDACAGRVVVLIGPNAAGKSTLLKAMAGLLPPAHGEVLFNGESVGSMASARRAAKIAWMSQRPSLTGRFTVREVVTIGRFARPRDSNAIDGAIEAAGLAEHADRIAEELSVGQQQRVAFARALAQVPQDGVLLLDEPFGPLDPAQAERAAREVRSRARAGGIVVVAVHELRLARALGDDVLGLRDGGVVVSGEVSTALDSEAIERLYNVPCVEGPEGPLPALRL